MAMGEGEMVVVDVVFNAILWLVASDATEFDGRLVRRGFIFSLFDFGVFFDVSSPAILLFPPFAGFLFPAPFFLSPPATPPPPPECGGDAPSGPGFDLPDLLAMMFSGAKTGSPETMLCEFSSTMMLLFPKQLSLSLPLPFSEHFPLS
jgi:hypothetical protein